jgi:hypothetical protein
MLPRYIVLLLLVVLPLTRVTAAWGEEVPLDSSAVETGLIENTPVYNGAVRGDASRLTLSNGFSNKLKFSNGLNMTTTLNIDKVKYREQDRQDITKEFSHNMRKIVKPGLTIGGLLSDQRINNRTLSFTGELQNYIQNKQRAQANADYTTALTEGVGANGWSTVFLTKDQLNFKVDKSVEGNIGGGVIYNKSNRLIIEERSFLSGSKSRAETSMFTIPGLSSREDSLLSKVSVQLTDSAKVGFEYTRYNSERSYVDLPRGTFLEQDLESNNIVRERELRKARIMNVSADMKPLRNVTLTLGAEHNEQVGEYAADQRRNSRTVGDFMNGKLRYTMGRNTEASVTLEEKKVLHDQGPQSVSSFNEKEQNFTFTFRHAFSPLTSWDMQTSASIHQVFYLDFETTPRDWDQFRQSVNSSIRSKLFSKVNVNIMLSATSLEVVNIHTSLSGDNRKETTYDLRPQFTYRISKRIELKQEYSLNIDFTDYVFTEEDNFLDRNIRFSNTALAHLTESLEMEFYYQLHLHDNGSYLRETPDAERLLSIDSKDRKNEAQLKCRYKLNNNLSALCEQMYSIRIDRRVRSGAETKFEDGEIKGGLRGNYKWGAGRSFNFTMLRVKRFGRFNTATQNDYWELDARMNYLF